MERHEQDGAFSRPELKDIKIGDVVYVRAIVTNIIIEAWSSDIAVEGYQAYGGHAWKAANVNSVDIWKRDEEDQP